MPGGRLHHSEKWHRCWEKVQGQGHDASSAAAICTASIGYEESYENLGGPGSGNFGHAGRPGEVGGSAEGDGGHEKGRPVGKDPAKVAKIGQLLKQGKSIGAISKEM